MLEIKEDGWRVEILEKIQKGTIEEGMTPVGLYIHERNCYMKKIHSISNKQYIPHFKRSALLGNIFLKSLQGRIGKGMCRGESQRRVRCYPRDKEQECGRWKENKNPQMELEDRKNVEWGMYRVRWTVLSEVTTGRYFKAFQ